MQGDDKRFEAWAIVEMFGHQRIAGRVSEQQVGGCAFVRVDVPAVEGCPAFTKLLGQGAIYAITITDEETATVVARGCCQRPMDEFSARRLLELPAADGEGPDDGDDRFEPF